MDCNERIIYLAGCHLMGFLFTPISCDIWEVLVALMLLSHLSCGFRLSARQKKDDGWIHIQMHHELLLFCLIRKLSSPSEHSVISPRYTWWKPHVFLLLCRCFVQHLLFFLKPYIAYQSSVDTDHALGR